MELVKHKENIFTIDGFWTKQTCEDLIAKSEAVGYEEATVTTKNGQMMLKEVRNNDRVLYHDEVLATTIWEALEPFAPSKFGNSKAIGLNELFRFYKYQAGQQFKKHRDQSYVRNETEASYFTFMIYLNDGYEGGETTFQDFSINPKQGTALIFQHHLLHAGTEVKQGVKYVLRTDIMYRLDASF